MADIMQECGEQVCVGIEDSGSRIGQVKVTGEKTMTGHVGRRGGP